MTQPSLEDRKLDWIERMARRLRRDPTYGKFTMNQRRVLAQLIWERKNGLATAPQLLGEDAAGRPVVERIDPGMGTLRRWAVKRDGDPGDIKEPVSLYREARANRVVSMDKLAVADTLAALSRIHSDLADSLYTRIMRTWGSRIDRSFLTLKHLSEQEMDLLVRVGAPVAGGVESPRFEAVYRNKELGQEVKLRTIEKPAEIRRFRVAGEGRPQFKLVKLRAIAPPSEHTPGSNTSSTGSVNHAAPAADTTTQEDAEMAATRTRKRTTKKSETAKKKSRTRKAAPADDEVDEELAELEEELEELDDIDDEEEPDDEVDDDEDEDDDEEEEEEKPAAKRRKRSTAKKSTSTRKRRRRSTEDDEAEDDEDDEDEEEAPRKRSRSKKSGGSSRAKKSSSNGVAGRSTADITGGVGTAELAKASGVDARQVRQYLRANDVEPDAEVGRYHWPSNKNKAFVALAKKIKAHYKD